MNASKDSLTEKESVTEEEKAIEADAAKKKLAVVKFASCDGCQLSILDMEDELLLLANTVKISYFLEATRTVEPGPYDVTLVEGSITTPHDMERLKKLRADSKFLISIGACATSGGIQALRNFADVKEFTKVVYARPDYIDTLDKSIPIKDVVPVDYELHGCPINKYQLLELLSAILQKRDPRIKNDSVCVECKSKGNLCILVAEKKPCLGPITHAGCEALCPSYGRGCFGCYGPKKNANTEAFMEKLSAMGVSDAECLRLLRTFNTWSEPFKKESEKWQNKTQDSLPT